MKKVHRQKNGKNGNKEKATKSVKNVHIKETKNTTKKAKKTCTPKRKRGGEKGSKKLEITTKKDDKKNQKTHTI